MNSNVEGSLSGGLGVVKSDVKSRIQADHTQSTQVLRKAIVQTSFKELRDLEHVRLKLTTPSTPTPRLQGLDDLKARLEVLVAEGWVVDPTHLRRGDLVEADVHLEADPIFRVNTIISTVREIIQENVQLFGVESASQLGDMRAIGRLLDSLLAGLVPLRGTLADYGSVTLAGKWYLARREVIEQVAGDHCGVAVLVGVAQRNLFWKDIRRILFSQGRYTIFCRLVDGDVKENWRPVQAMDLLSDLHPMFDDFLGGLGEGALVAMETAIDASQQRARSRRLTKRLSPRSWTCMPSITR